MTDTVKAFLAQTFSSEPRIYVLQVHGSPEGQDYITTEVSEKVIWGDSPEVLFPVQKEVSKQIRIPIACVEINKSFFDPDELINVLESGLLSRESFN